MWLFASGAVRFSGSSARTAAEKRQPCKMLTGLLPVTEGSAKLFGKPMAADDMEARRNVGYMSQAFSLYSELTVRQNLELHAHLYHLPPNEIGRRIAELLERYDLKAVADAKPESLPLGVKQSAAARGGRTAPARHADSRRADVGRRSGRPRPVLAHADRSLPQRRRHDLSLNALHERGRALRPDFADASRPRARRRRAGGARTKRGSASLEDAFISYQEEAAEPRRKENRATPAGAIAGETRGIARDIRCIAHFQAI